MTTTDAPVPRLAPSASALAAAHAALPGPEREVLAFIFVSGLTLGQVADLMGLTPEAVAELGELGLRRLAERLWGDGVPADQALRRAARAYAGWRWTAPAPAVRRAVLDAAFRQLAGGGLDNAPVGEQASVQR